MSDFLQTVSEMTYDRLIPFALLFVCGLLLWTAGRRVMRTGLAAAGFLMGGIVGWSFGEGADLGVAPWIAGVSGAVIVAVVATLAYRLAVAGAVGILIATLAPMAVWTADERELLAFVDRSETPPAPMMVEQPPLAIPGGEAAPGAVPETAGTGGEAPSDLIPTLGGAGTEPAPMTPELEGWLEDIFSPDPGTDPGATGGAATEAGADEGSVGNALRRPFEVVAEKFGSAWESAAPGMRGIFVAAAAFGAMIGFVIGALAPAFSATVVSALGGSFLMLVTGCVLAAHLGFSGEAKITQSATFWTALWLIVALLGLGIQSIFRPRSADKAAS